MSAVAVKPLAGTPRRFTARVVIQSRTLANVGGEATETWATLATVFAEVVPLAGREQLVALQVHPTATHRFTTHWRTDITITADCRLTVGSDTYYFLEPARNLGGLNRELEALVGQTP